MSSLVLYLKYFQPLYQVWIESSIWIFIPCIYYCIVYGTNNIFKIYFFFMEYFLLLSCFWCWLSSLIAIFKKKKWILKGNFPFLVDLFLGGDFWFIPWSCLPACLVILDWTLGLFLCRQALQRRWCRLGQQQELLVTRPRQSGHEISRKYQLYC